VDPGPAIGCGPQKNIVLLHTWYQLMRERRFFESPSAETANVGDFLIIRYVLIQIAYFIALGELQELTSAHSDSALRHYRFSARMRIVFEKTRSFCHSGVFRSLFSDAALCQLLRDGVRSLRKNPKFIECLPPFA
jgi:hypothetical protein